jgi:glycosyltransferase involved in cell wall biosynthesis
VGGSKQNSNSFGENGLPGRLKIAFLGIKSYPAMRGADRVVEGIVQNLRDRHDITVYCCSRLTPPSPETQGIKIVRIPTVHGKHLEPIIYFLASAIYAFFHRYDGIHIHNAEACFIIPILRLRFPVLATAHGPAYSREKWGKLSRWLIEMVDLFYIYSSNQRTSVSLPYARYYKKRYHREIKYIPNGIDKSTKPDIIGADSFLRDHQVIQPFLLFSAGRLDPTKGCHILLEAFSVIRWPGSLLILGDETTHSDYSKQLKQTADGRTLFLQPVSSRNLLYGIIRKSIIYIFPSTVEAMSMSLLEAASLGTPVVCSDIPENRLVMGDSAVYFTSGDPHSLRKQLEWAINNRVKMKVMAEHAVPKIHDKFDWRKISDQYEKIYIQMFC